MFLSMAQARELIGLSTWAMRNAAKTGRLPGARKIGGRWFIHRPTLENYFASSVPATHHVTPSNATK